MVRTLSLVLLLLVVSANGLAQNKFEGKWATDRPQSPEILHDREKRDFPVQLEITVVSAKSANDINVKGTLSLGGLGGNFHTFDQVKVIGSRFYFRLRLAQSTYSTWYAQLVDDNTITLWSHGLDLVADNVLDLLKMLPGAALPPATPPAAQAVQTAQVTPITPAATSTDPPPSCSNQLRCYVLRRVK